MNARALWNAGPDGGYSYADAILANVAGDSRRPGTVQSLHPVTSIHGESALLCQVAHDSVEEASTTARRSTVEGASSGAHALETM